MDLKKELIIAVEGAVGFGAASYVLSYLAQAAGAPTNIISLMSNATILGVVLVLIGGWINKKISRWVDKMIPGGA